MIDVRVESGREVDREAAFAQLVGQQRLQWLWRSTMYSWAGWSRRDAAGSSVAHSRSTSWSRNSSRRIRLVVAVPDSPAARSSSARAGGDVALPEDLQQLRLAAEVAEQPLVGDAGASGDVAQGGLVEAVLDERFAGRGDDRGPACRRLGEAHSDDVIRQRWLPAGHARALRAGRRKATGRKVVGFMSGNPQDRDMICEVFVLAPSRLRAERRCGGRRPRRGPPPWRSLVRWWRARVRRR